MNGLSLEDAKILIAQGERFGDVYPLLQDVERDGDRLKEFYVRMTPQTTIETRGTCTPDTPLPTTTLDEVGYTNGSMQQYTGNVCTLCGSVRMVKSGTCDLCLECGTTSGC